MAIAGKLNQVRGLPGLEDFCNTRASTHVRRVRRNPDNADARFYNYNTPTLLRSELLMDCIRQLGGGGCRPRVKAPVPISTAVSTMSA